MTTRRAPFETLVEKLKVDELVAHRTVGTRIALKPSNPYHIMRLKNKLFKKAKASVAKKRPPHCVMRIE